MFPFYAIPVGLVAGWLLGGRLEGIAQLRFRWAWVAIAGLLLQIVLFSGAVDRLIGGLGPALYVGSTAAVLAAVLRNLAIPGIALVALGAISNLAAIVANGGYMPTDRGALALAGIDPSTTTFSNSVLLDEPKLRPLTDIFAIPEALPISNVFSVGDVLIGVGVAATIALAMRRAHSPDGREAARDGEGAASGRESAEATERGGAGRSDPTVRRGNSPD